MPAKPTSSKSKQTERAEKAAKTRAQNNERERQELERLAKEVEGAHRVFRLACGIDSQLRLLGGRRAKHQALKRAGKLHNALN